MTVERTSLKVLMRDRDGLVQTKPARYDQVAVEAPLQIVLAWFCQETSAVQHRPLMVTMRTPDDDQSLVLGTLFALGVLSSAQDVVQWQEIEANILEVTLAKGLIPDWQQLHRVGASTTSCGVCGQKQIQQLALIHDSVTDNRCGWLSAEFIMDLPDLLRTHQAQFSQTGGVHGAAIFSEDSLVAVCEDVGRHNAVDKVIGQQLMQLADKGESVRERLSQSLLMLSGRVSFELMHKAILANIPVVVAIGSPSSLAIKLAKQFNITLIGFTKNSQCNVYSGEARLK